MKVFNKLFEFPFKLRSMWAMISRVKHDTNVMRLTDDSRSHETILSFNCLKKKRRNSNDFFSMFNLDRKKRFYYRIHWRFSSWTKACCVDDFNFSHKYSNKTSNESFGGGLRFTCCSTIYMPKLQLIHCQIACMILMNIIGIQSKLIE